ncbi:MAG: putative peptidoglycan glycosyltransferase FtsW [bacterium]|nr:putative peptidoglycan glycosyltransferase FtsW [bacterium]
MIWDPALLDYLVPPKDGQASQIMTKKLIMSGKTHTKEHAPDYLILFSTGFLVLFGLFILSSASAHLGQQDFGDSYYYLKHQIYYGLLLGFLGFLITSKIYYGFWRKRWVSLTLFALSIGALLLVFTPLGLTAKGATRWIDIAGLSLQPSEFLKLTLVIYLATWLSSKDFRNKSFRSGYIPFVLIIGLVSLILFIQHSTSPVVILVMAALVMYFMSGAKWRYVLGTIVVGVAVLALIIANTQYRSDRFLSYLTPEADPRGAGYHVIQATTAIGAGQLTGVGYGQSIVKYRLPEPIGDSIFAVIAEEFGFIGVLVLLTVFGALILKIFLLARSMTDTFGRLLLVGFGSILAIQTFVNIGAMTGILPLTGTPLPFISYGGTALMVYLTMMGVVVNVSKYH